jgi:acyl transferase domain-containing protein
MSGAGWVFAFPGLQPFDPAAARALEAAWPGTARVLAQCEQAARRAGGVSILAAWRGAHGTAPIVDCRLCYPLNLAYQAALLARLAEAGIEPAAVVGISAGETAAAYSAGMLSLEDAMRVAIHTGAALEEHQKWQRIASLHTSAAHVDALVDEERSQVDVSMIVSDQLTVISGDAGAIERILARARRADIGHTEVGFGFGAHNRRMNAMREPLMHALRGLRPRAPACRVASPAVGGWLTHARHADAELWWLHASERISFLETLDKLWQEGYRRFVEMGPRSLFTAALSQRGAEAVPALALTTVAHAR